MGYIYLDQVNQIFRKAFHFLPFGSSVTIYHLPLRLLPGLWLEGDLTYHLLVRAQDEKIKVERFVRYRMELHVLNECFILLAVEFHIHLKELRV